MRVYSIISHTFASKIPITVKTCKTFLSAGLIYQAKSTRRLDLKTLWALVPVAEENSNTARKAKNA